MRKVLVLRSLVVVVLLLAMGQVCFAQFGVSISVGFAPPELPVYEQPPCPGDGYLWTPGYWAWDPDADDYYWVPGTWVEVPEVGFFWTPPYWGWESGRYFFHPGWWGPHVGFYGGIVYGFGYFGHGYEGGRWEGGHFFYNRYVNNINVTVVRNVYETRIETREVTRVSFNGGNGGINARATAEEEGYSRERHITETRVQTEHIQAARGNTEFRASANHGRPPVAATARAGQFSGHEVVAARSSGNYNRPPMENTNRPPNASHMRDVPAYQRPAPPNTGNAQLDQKYQQQQNKLYEKQNQERQKLEQKQEQDHQRAQQQNYGQERQQQMEQHHQQQTQQMQQRHQQQQQQMQQRQSSHGGSQHH